MSNIRPVALTMLACIALPVFAIQPYIASNPTYQAIQKLERGADEKAVLAELGPAKRRDFDETQTGYIYCVDGGQMWAAALVFKNGKLARVSQLTKEINGGGCDDNLPPALGK